MFQKQVFKAPVKRWLRVLWNHGLKSRFAVAILEREGRLQELRRGRAGIWAANLDDARYGVLVDMTFNLGIGELMNFPHFLEAMKDRDWPLAAKEMLDSKWAKQVGLRADQLAIQVKTGTWQ